MSASMRVIVSTPAGAEVLEPVLRLRLDATDGSRGVLPGHEPARLCFVAGPVEIVRPGPEGERTDFLATEGGVAQIEPSGVTLVCRWTAQADSLSTLRERVVERRAVRAQAEREARALAHRHEVATRRALAGLRREFGR